jgi:hypothetical protein
MMWRQRESRDLDPDLVDARAQGPGVGDDPEPRRARRDAPAGDRLRRLVHLLLGLYLLPALVLVLIVGGLLMALGASLRFLGRSVRVLTGTDRRRAATGGSIATWFRPATVGRPRVCGGTRATTARRTPDS